MDTSRIAFYDAARGIAIVLVIFSHCVGGGFMGVNKTILCFHMPLFFFISGCFAKGPLEGGGYYSFLIKKIKVLMIPQLTLCLLRVVQSVLTSLNSNNGLAAVQWIHWDWFLPVLLGCTLLYTLVVSWVKNDSRVIKVLMLIASVVLIIGGQWLNKHGFYYHAIINSRHLAVFPMAFLFYVLGSICKAYIPQIISNTSVCHGLFLLLSLPAIYIIANENEIVLMYMNEYGNLPLFFVSCLLGLYFVINISKRLDTSSFLVFAGQNSISLYVWNFIVIQIMISIANRLLSFAGMDRLGFTGLIAFIMSMILLYIIVRVTNKYCSWIYGRK